MEVAEAIVDVINNALIGFVKGTNLFMGGIREIDDDIPGKACFVLVSGGVAPTTYGIVEKDMTVPAIQIFVRSEAGRDKMSSGETIAKAVQNAVHKSSPEDCLVGGAIAQQTNPIFLGADNKGHYLWSINFNVYRKDQ